MKKMICFDMDGTIADLYGVPNWLEKIRAEDASPYRDAKPMWDMEKLKEVLLKLSAESWEIRVITWLSMDSTEEFKKAVRAEKRAWLNRHKFPVGSCHMVAYGTTKANCVRKSTDHAILIDDNSKIRGNWSLGRTIDPAEGNLIEELEKLLEN